MQTNLDETSSKPNGTGLSLDHDFSDPKAMHAFMSHSSKDAEFAFRVVEILEAHGIKCWIAPRDIPPGANYAAEILQAIQSSSCVALIFTEEANSSPHVLREVERAITFRRPILPLVSAEVSPTGAFDYFLATLQYPRLQRVSDPKAVTGYAEAVVAFLQGHRADPQSFSPRSTSRAEAYEKLRSMATDLELNYRKACREKASDDEWTAVDAIQVTINEFLIANRQHFPDELRKATQTFSKSVERLAKAARASGDSPAASDFAITTSISQETLEAGKELYQANLEFERNTKLFEAALKRHSKPPGLFQRLFGGS